MSDLSREAWGPSRLCGGQDLEWACMADEDLTSDQLPGKAYMREECCKASKPCVKLDRTTVQAIETMGFRLVTCEEKRRRRRLQGLNPGLPCKKSKKQEVSAFHI